ncbi:hypothetical protein [Tepidibacillus marianensis]|uniref:hypothetical protein n=1 Tax=Tepidibacillus marianensis TaxID=3131995 RepID=UPI0030D27898
MTRLEQIHTLLNEDKDALVGSYLSLLAFIDVHQNVSNNPEQFVEDLAHTVHRHIEVLPTDSVPIFQELENNETKRLEALKAVEEQGVKQ